MSASRRTVRTPLGPPMSTSFMKLPTKKKKNGLHNHVQTFTDQSASPRIRLSQPPLQKDHNEMEQQCIPFSPMECMISSFH